MRKPLTDEQRAAKKIYDRERYMCIRILAPKRELRSRYRFVNDGKNNGITAHKVIAEKVLKRPLPDGVEIHHVDNNGHNNEHRNLVICEDRAYHALLHRRVKALAVCGNVNWLPCVFCKQWDAPENMTLYIPKDQTSPRANHARCATEYSARRRSEALHDRRPL
jgi:hypothetical protein